MKVKHVIVKTGKKKKYVTLHDQDITPPRTGDQILAALKQQYDVTGFVIEDGTATAFVEKLDEAE